MTSLIGLVMVAVGVTIVWFGRPAAGGRFAALMLRPGMGVIASLVMTTMVCLGIAFTIAGAVDWLGG